MCLHSHMTVYLFVYFPELVKLTVNDSNDNKASGKNTFLFAGEGRERRFFREKDVVLSLLLKTYPQRCFLLLCVS